MIDKQVVSVVCALQADCDLCTANLLRFCACMSALSVENHVCISEKLDVIRLNLSSQSIS